MQSLSIQASTHPKDCTFTKVPSSIAFHKEAFDPLNPDNPALYPTHNHHVLHRIDPVTGNRQSNTRIVTWSDGSKQLWIGNSAVADIETANVRNEHRHLYLKQNNDQYWLHYHYVTDTAILQAKSSRSARFTAKERKQTKMEVVESTSDAIRRAQIDARNEEIRLQEQQNQERRQNQNPSNTTSSDNSIYSEDTSIFDSLGVDPDELDNLDESEEEEDINDSIFKSESLDLELDSQKS